MTRILRRLIPLLACLIPLLVTVPDTAAHGYLIRSIPQDRATLERPPTRLQYWFSEGLEPRFSRINLRNQAGEVIAEGAVDAADDTLLKLRVPTNLPDGAYIVELAPAFASDGHVIVESRVFFVGNEVGGVQGEGASTSAIPLEVIWKALLYNGVFLLFGTYLLYAYVLVPVWGSEKYPQGLLPPRVMRRLAQIVWGAIALTFAGSLLALVQQTMVFFNVGAEQAITGSLWQIVLSGSRFGDVWNARLFFLLILVLSQGAAHVFADRYPKSVRSFWTANVWVAALVVGAQAVNSHAAGSLVWPWVAILVHWLHTLAVAFWLGGIAALMFLLPVALAPYEGATRWQALRPVMKRFSRYTVSAALITITAGMYLAGNYLFAPADIATTYGAALGYKLVMVALLLLMGALHHIALRPHLLDYVPDNVHQVAAWARRFTGSIRLETLVALLAMGSAALLSATPTPEPAFLDKQVQTPVATQQVADYTVQVSVIPGGPGVNTCDVVVRQRDTDDTVTGLDVQVQFAAPERGVRGSWHTAEAVDSGLYVTAGDDIDRGGRWWTLVDIFSDDGTLTRAAFEWDISDDAAVIQLISPTPANGLTGVLLLLALAYALYPSLRALVHRMDTSPLTLLVVGLSVLLSLTLIPGSVWLLEENTRRVNQQLNPPPQQINPILPDNESVQQGEQLYNAHCLAWQTDSDFLVLLRGIGTMRDDTLFTITAEGWRDMPPCDDTLTESERWHVVNYARTLRTRAD